MIPRANNVAYIDGANLHKGIAGLEWELDYRRFRIWLAEKYAVKQAYLFIGLVPKYSSLYASLQEAGFMLVFKETIHDSEGRIKGNCDAELVLQAVRDFYEHVYDSAILVSSDGDYSCLARFLREKNKIRVILSPSTKCSVLLMRTHVPITYLDSQRSILAR